MLNIKKHGIFSREEKGNCQEYQDRGGVPAMWGSPGGGRITMVVELARHLTNRKRNVSSLLYDMITPMLPYICPPGDLGFKYSLGSALTATHVTQDLMRQNCVVHKHQDYLMILGMQRGENEYIYSPHSVNQATELTDCSWELTPYIIIDCSSYIANNILPAIALMEADSVLRLVRCDLKSISYLSSQLPLLQGRE